MKSTRRLRSAPPPERQIGIGWEAPSAIGVSEPIRRPRAGSPRREREARSPRAAPLSGAVFSCGERFSCDERRGSPSDTTLLAPWRSRPPWRRTNGSGAASIREPMCSTWPSGEAGLPAHPERGRAHSRAAPPTTATGRSPACLRCERPAQATSAAGDCRPLRSRSSLRRGARPGCSRCSSVLPGDVVLPQPSWVS